MIGRDLDGHVSRSLEGKTIERIYKDGRTMIIRCSNGEEFTIAWATPNGIGIEGEPCLVKVDVKLELEGVAALAAAAEV